MKRTSDALLREPKKSFLAEKISADWLLSPYAENTWKVKGNYGNIYTIHFDVVMPDGATHSSPLHLHRMEAVKWAVFEARGKANEKIGADFQLATAKELIQFSSWLVLNRIYHFADVGEFTISNYIQQCSDGIEVCLQSVQRVDLAMQKILQNREVLSSFRSSEIFKLAGIPPGWISKLPVALKFVKASKDEGRCINAPEKIGKQLSTGSLCRKAKSIENLWSNATDSLDSLPENSFSEDIYGLIRKWGKRSGHTKTIPVAVAFHMAKNAVDWVTSIGPVLLEFEETIGHGQVRGKIRDKLKEDFFARPEIKNVPRDVFVFSRKGVEVLKLRGAIFGFLACACFVVIAMLTARRKMEILMLKANAVKGNETDGWWLRSVIEKTLQKEDVTPCSPLVVAAIRILERIASADGIEDANDRLFRFPKLNKNGQVDFRIDVWLNKFPYKSIPYDQVPIYDSWSFAAHQFRRIFAILFVWRYEGDLNALSHHLRHFNLKMTSIYVRDAELNRHLDDEYHRLTAEKMQQIANESVVPAGVLGRSLKRAIEKMRHELEIFDDYDLERKIERFVIDKEFRLKATPWGYCGSSARASNIRRAACQQSSNRNRQLSYNGTPDETGSSESICAGCMFHLTDSSRAQHWDDYEKKINALLENDGLSNLMREVITKRAKVIKIFVRKSFGSKEVV